jgi:hypothetical protein
MPGHELICEGAAHSVRGQQINLYGGVGGTGYGKCSCGKLSPITHSGRERKAWHRAHKEELRKESNR